MYALLVGGLLVAAPPDVPKAESKAPAKAKDALPMNVDPGFPVLPPIPNADPSIRRKKAFRLPTRLQVKRTDDQIAVGVDPDSLKAVKLDVGANMVTGLKDELFVYRGGKSVLPGKHHARPLRSDSLCLLSSTWPYQVTVGQASLIHCSTPLCDKT
jgi:hypothetical protein